MSIGSGGNLYAPTYPERHHVHRLGDGVFLQLFSATPLWQDLLGQARKGGHGGSQPGCGALLEAEVW